MKNRLSVILLLILTLTACIPTNKNPENGANPPPDKSPTNPIKTQPFGTQDTSPAAQPTNMGDSLEVSWVKSFTGPDYGAFFDLIRAEDDNLIVVGATNHRHMPPYSGDSLILKLSPAGEIIWEKTWGGEGYEQAWEISPAEDGGYLIFGETDSYGAGDRDFFLLKTDQEGIQESFRTYGGSLREWPFGMLSLSNGDLLLYGLTELDDGTGRNEYAVRVGNSGDVIWEHIGEGLGEELVLDALEIRENEIILVVSADEDAKLVTLDKDGHLLRENLFEIPGWQYFSTIAPIDGGDLILAGFWMKDGPPRQADTWLMRCTSDAKVIWEKTLGDPKNDDYAQSLIRLADGNFLIGGLGEGMPLTLVDEHGGILWQQSLLGSGVYLADALLEQEAGFLAAGFVQLINGQSYDAILVQMNLEEKLGE
ncbi:MAG: hypothetical protein JW757_11800 [Anaerolineales bacterium]|nr:hypothetical protein [Anaerolineales bacterium]